MGVGAGLALLICAAVIVIRRRKASAVRTESAKQYFDQSPTVVEMYEQIVRRATAAVPTLPNREGDGEGDADSHAVQIPERTVSVNKPLRTPAAVVADL